MALKSGVGRGRLRAATACAALTLAAGTNAGPVGATAQAASTPARDSFSGQLVRASGRFAHDHGDVALRIHIAQASAATRQMTLTLSGPTCGRQRHCLRLLGTLSGTISEQPGTIPDVGKRYALLAGGRLTALGRVSATGEVVGVGFIRQGREGLTLTLRTPAGAVTIAARSPEVPGFTSP